VIDVSAVGAVRYWHRNVVVFRRTWILGLMAWFIEPVIYLVAMGTGLGAYLRRIEGLDYIDFIAPGLMAVSSMWGATFEATWNAYFKLDRARIYEAVASTPVSVQDVALGEILWSTTRATIYGTAFAVVATPFGVFKSWWGILTIPAIALLGLSFSIAGLSYAYWVRRVDYLAYYWTLFLTPMFMFAGVFFPLERLPGWVQAISWFMPLRHGADLMRALMVHGDPVAAGRSALWLAATSLVLFPLPLWLLRRRLVQE
jgi:lipooligosaccharide transport system permease protein